MSSSASNVRIRLSKPDRLSVGFGGLDIRQRHSVSTARLDFNRGAMTFCIVILSAFFIDLWRPDASCLMEESVQEALLVRTSAVRLEHISYLGIWVCAYLKIKLEPSTIGMLPGSQPTRHTLDVRGVQENTYWSSRP